MLKKFPFYKQHDQMDCDPTCLRVIAKHFGRSYSLQYLRDRAFLNREGVSLLGISHAAEEIGLRTLGVKLSFDKIKNEAPLPFIVHWNQSHFVVVHKITKRSVHVADPANGLLLYSIDEFKKHWHSSIEHGEQVGIALLLEPTSAFFGNEDEQEIASIQELSRLYTYLGRYKRFKGQLFLGLLLGSWIIRNISFCARTTLTIKKINYL